MSCEIKIRNLKNVKSLDFKIPDQGVWVITGMNGSGKSSLLASILRIWDPYAFQKNFKVSKTSKGRVDSFRGASITYLIGAETVSYQYTEERWTPTPRKNSKLFEKISFKSVTYMAADPDRIQPRQEDLSPRRIRAADPTLIQFANEIFETTRFNELRKVNVTRGASEALLIEVPGSGSKKSYYSEKNFSLGEICVLKLLRSVLKQPPGSLVLIDEVELALHPRAQIKLFHVLQQLASERELTVLLSSHSVTLIKAVERKRIIFLEGLNGTVTARHGCFPSYILGQVALTEESSKDAIFCVEDDHSDFLLEAIIERFKSTLNDPAVRTPQYSIIRIGGASQVIKVVEACQRMLLDSTRRFGILDQDVEETIRTTQLETAPRAYLRANQQLFKFLPVTPEVGLLRWLTNSPNALEQICNRLNAPRNQITLNTQLGGQVLARTGTDQRDGAKGLVNELLRSLQARSGKELAIVNREVYFLYVQSLTGDEWETAQTLARSILFGAT